MRKLHGNNLRIRIDYIEEDSVGLDRGRGSRVMTEGEGAGRQKESV